jgi:microcystin-dependent protein
LNGLGAKSLKQYNSVGNKVDALVTGGMLADIEYDGVDFIVLDALPGASQAGEVQFFAGSTAPPGFLKANGAVVARLAYSELFAAIGTTYGAGDGVNTFSLPDLRGEFLRGADDGRGVDSGRTIGSAQAATAIGGYVHSDAASAGATAAITVYNQNADGPGAVMTGPNAAYYMAAASASNGGSSYNGSFTVRPRNVALLACIKY